MNLYIKFTSAYNDLAVYWIWRSTEIPSFTLKCQYSLCYVIFNKRPGHCSRHKISWLRRQTIKNIKIHHLLIIQWSVRFRRCQRRFRSWRMVLKMESEVSRFPVSSVYRPVSAGTIIVCCKGGYRGVIDIKRFIWRKTHLISWFRLYNACYHKWCLYNNFISFLSHGVNPSKKIIRPWKSGKYWGLFYSDYTIYI